MLDSRASCAACQGYTEPPSSLSFGAFAGLCAAMTLCGPFNCFQVKGYTESGYLWENYDDEDGHGKGSHPFTGWTALLVLVAGQTY